jgi:hypothetical protein
MIIIDRFLAEELMQYLDEAMVHLNNASSTINKCLFEDVHRVEKRELADVYRDETTAYRRIRAVRDALSKTEPVELNDQQ